MEENVRIQFSDSKNLDSRIQIYQFGKKQDDLQTWVFDRLNLDIMMEILVVGCGNGLLWKKNHYRIPPHCHIILSDISEGMIKDAEKLLSDVEYDFEYQIIDAQSIPLQKNHFDLIIANHVLFFIPNIGQALQEIKRVLKPQGKLYATTASTEHLKELFQMAVEFDVRLELIENPMQRFNLENGKAILEEYFTNVERYDYKDELVIPTVEPLITYLRSVYKSKEFAFLPKRLPEFRRFFQKKNDQNQSITITSYSGMFKAEKAEIKKLKPQ